jgi:hypothetical protein
LILVSINRQFTCTPLSKQGAHATAWAALVWCAGVWRYLRNRQVAVPRFFYARTSRLKADLTSKIQPMNQLANLNYNYEEIEVLKILAKFQNDPDKASVLILSGLDEYEHTRIVKIIEKFYNDGIWDIEDTEDGKGRSTFTIDLQEFILNYPNPIPENLRSGIDIGAILEKLSCSNLDPFEVNFIRALIKRDASTNS